MQTLWQDLRYGARKLIKSPGFTFTAILTLSLGIGANTAIFSIVNAVLLQSLPYQNANELVMFSFTNAQGEEEGLLGLDAYLNLKNHNRVFTDVAAWGNDGWAANLTVQGEAERLQGFQVSANLFQVLGIKAIQGRTFEEESSVNDRVVVISYDLWQRRFAGNPGMIGQTIFLNGSAYKVIGVMPANFHFILQTDVWTTLPCIAEQGGRNKIYLHQLARRKLGVATEQIQAEVENLLRPYTENPNAKLRAVVKPLQTVLTIGERQMLFILFAAAGFVLLIACVNIANLLLTRAATRRKEMAIRLALGAGRWRLVQQLLVESAMLAFIGSAGGLLLADWCLGLLISGLPESVAAKNANVAVLKIDGWALGYTLALALLTTLLCGLVPAFQTSKVNFNEALKEGGRSDSPRRGQPRLRSLLVVTEVALTLMLLVGAGLMLKSFWRLTHVNRGFDSAGVLTAKIDLSGDQYREPHQVVRFYQQLVERVAAIPGVQQVGIVNSWEKGWRIAIAEHASVPEEQRPLASRHPVNTDYFSAMGIPLRAGRWFTNLDVKGAPSVAIIDETLAQRLFPNENPLGKHLQFEDTAREIVGVVGATRAWRRYTFNSNEWFPRVYLPYQQEPGAAMALMVRSSLSDPMRLRPAMRQELGAIDNKQPIHSFKMLSQSVAELSADRRFSTWLLTAFAALAMLLAVIGIYGVVSYMVTQRTHEIGLRLALGAKPGEVLKLILRQGMMKVLIGLALGSLGALAMTRLMQSFLFGISSTGPLTFAVVAVILTGVALVACFGPAHRATKIDPMIALRYE
ncbi:MAG: ABC transporter permease [Acidobacteria bacterium]|nr:ABC transporter permease [Acidobacteriota bacterium]